KISMDTLAPMVSFPILIIKEHSITEWCNAKEHKREEKSRPNEEGKKAEDRGPRCQCCLSTDMEPAYPMETKPPSAVAACRRAMSSEDFRFSSVISVPCKVPPGFKAKVTSDMSLLHCVPSSAIFPGLITSQLLLCKSDNCLVSLFCKKLMFPEHGKGEVDGDGKDRKTMAATAPTLTDMGHTGGPPNRSLICSKDRYELVNCGNSRAQEAETSGHPQVLDLKTMYTESSRPARATQ
ncbi:hypothetical protein STEG23_000335, partial [Scotinomys teguina]